MPRATVVIPVYNGARWLPATLASLSAQTSRDVEFLLVDDCSTDESFALLEQFAQTDSRARVLRLASNRGSVPRVLNAVLPEIVTDFFAYSSQDDLYSVNWIEACLGRALETGADAVLPDTVFLDEAVAINRRIVGLHGLRDLVISGREAVQASLDWSISGFALWRSTIVRTAGFSDFCASADEFSTRAMFLACGKVAFADATFFYRQDNPDAVTKKLSFRPFEQPITNLAVFRLLIANEFDAHLCRQEMMRTVSSLLYCRRLMLKAGWKLARAERRRAAEAMARGAEALSEPDVRAFIASQRRLLSLTERFKLRLTGL
jgi:glycosyltransferase involved in cell wall biosynthesis